MHLTKVRQRQSSIEHDSKIPKRSLRFFCGVATVDVRCFDVFATADQHCLCFLRCQLYSCHCQPVLYAVYTAVAYVLGVRELLYYGDNCYVIREANYVGICGKIQPQDSDGYLVSLWTLASIVDQRSSIEITSNQFNEIIGDLKL